MANNFLNLGMLSVLTWLLVSGLAPCVRSADSNSSATVNATGQSGLPEMRRAPVPLVRKAPPRVPIAVVEPAPPSLPPAVEPTNEAQPAEPAPRDPFDSKAAKTAVEADGYKRVTVLGKGPNGSWRAKGFRGTTEVLLTVDDTGRVSMD